MNKLFTVGNTTINHACELNTLVVRQTSWLCFNCLCIDVECNLYIPSTWSSQEFTVNDRGCSVQQWVKKCHNNLGGKCITLHGKLSPHTTLIRHTHSTCMHSYIFTFMIRMLTLLSHFWSEMHVLNLYIYYKVRDCEGYEVSPGPGTVWMKPMAVFSHFRHQSLGHHSS